jgi:hypothetical protein
MTSLPSCVLGSIILHQTPHVNNAAVRALRLVLVQLHAHGLRWRNVESESERVYEVVAPECIR